MNSKSTHILLDLLQGPTKSLVTSALTIGAGSAIITLSSSPNTAHCLVYRQPYDTDVFDESNTVKPSIPLDHTAQHTNLDAIIKRRRPVGIAALSALLGTKNITLTYTRNICLSSLLVIHEYTQILLELEQEAADSHEDVEYPPFPMPALIQSSLRGTINGCLDLATQIIRSLFDWAATGCLSYSLSNRLKKEMRSSALRKMKHPWYVRGVLVTRTSLFSEATLYMADWVVASGTEIYRNIARASATSISKTSSVLTRPRQAWDKKRIHILSTRILLQGIRCTILWAFVSVGNGLGSMFPVYPTLVMFGFSQLIGFLVNSYCAAFIARYTAEPLPPPPPSLSSSGDDGHDTGARTAVIAAHDDVLQAYFAARGTGDVQEERGHGIDNDAPSLLPTNTTLITTTAVDSHITAANDPEESGSPAAPIAPTPQQRPRAGPVLPDRRPHRRPLAHHQNIMAGGNVFLAGPETPQAREPRLNADEITLEDQSQLHNNNGNNNMNQQNRGGGGVDASPLPPVTPPGAAPSSSSSNPLIE